MFRRVAVAFINKPKSPPRTKERCRDSNPFGDALGFFSTLPCKQGSAYDHHRDTVSEVQASIDLHAAIAHQLDLIDPHIYLSDGVLEGTLEDRVSRIMALALT